MSRPLRVALRVLIAVAVVFVAGVGAAALRIDDVRASASRVRSAAERAATELRNGDFDAASVSLEVTVESLALLRRELDHPQLAIARVTPWISSELAASGDLIDAASDAVSSFRGLSDDVGSILGSDRAELFRSDGRMHLGRLDALRRDVEDVLPSIRDAADRAALHAARLRTSIAQRAASPLVEDLIRVRDTLTHGVTVLELVPQLLGSERPRSLLIVLQNLAESRGTGGLIGGYAVLRTTEGTLTVDRVASNAELKIPPTTPPVPMPPWFASRYDRYFARSSWSNVNMHPDLPVSAALIAQMFEDTTGTAIDGIMMMDPVTLEHLVDATGAVSTPGLTFEPGSTAETIMIDSYTRFGVGYEKEAAGARRKEAMVAVAMKLLPRLFDPQHIIGVATALADASSTRHLALWSDESAEQAQIAALGLDGTVLGSTDAWIGVGFNNGAANKIDAYLDRTMNVSSETDGDETTITARAGFALDVPDLYALPAFVTGPFPDTEGLVAGQSRLLVALYLPPDATVTDRTEGSQISRIPGAVVVDAIVDVFPDRPADLTVTFTIPTTNEPVDILSAPGARPLIVSGSATS